MADAELALEDLVIGLPVLKHLCVDTKTLLEKRRNLLDESDCAKAKAIKKSDKTGPLGRLMIACLNGVGNYVV